MNLPISPGYLVILLVILGALAVVGILGKVPLSYNIRNLFVRWPMSVLTAFAFTIVIFLLTAMLAFINGMSKLTDDSGHAENVVVLADGSNDESFSTLGFTDTSDIDHEPGVAQNAEGKALCSREVYILASQSVAPKPGKATGTVGTGLVKRVVANEGRVIVTENDNDITYKMEPTTPVFINEGDGRLEFVKPGDLLWAAYEQRGDVRAVSELRVSNKRRFVQVRGVEDPAIAADVHGLELLSGHWFSDAGVEELPAEPGKQPETAVQAVLGEGAAKAIGPDVGKESLEVGDVFLLGPKRWKVVGILKASGTVFGSEVWTKRSYIGDLYGKPSTISSITIRTKSPADAEALTKALKDYKLAKLNPQTETDYYSQQRTFLLIIRTAIIVLTVFMALGGIFGVMNTMFAAISQRTKDIGVLRIIGYARWQVLVSFLLESMVLALFGGLLGCALGMLVHGRSMTSVVGAAQGFGKTVVLQLSVTPNTILVGVLLTLIMGLLGGLLPALTAMRLRALESLR